MHYPERPRGVFSLSVWLSLRSIDGSELGGIPESPLKVSVNCLTIDSSRHAKSPLILARSCESLSIRWSK